MRENSFKDVSLFLPILVTGFNDGMFSGAEGVVMMVSGTGVVRGAGVVGAGVVMMVSGGQVLPLS